MASPIKFYFDFVSAYSYVAMNRIEKIAKHWGERSSGTACRCLRFWRITTRPRRVTSPRSLRTT